MIYYICMLCTKTETYLMKNESPFWCWITNSYSDLQNCAVKLIWSCNDKSSKTASSRVTPFMSISLTLRILSPGCRPRKIFFPLEIKNSNNLYLNNYPYLDQLQKIQVELLKQKCPLRFHRLVWYQLNHFFESWYSWALQH